MGTIPAPNIVGDVASGQQAYANAFADPARFAALRQQTAVESQQEQALRTQNQMAQMELQDQKTVRDLMPQFVQKDETGRPTGYDFNGLIAAAQGKVMPGTLFKLQQQQATMRQSLATATKDELGNQENVNNQLYQRSEALKGIQDPEERQAHYEATRQWATKNGVNTSVWPQQAPDNDHLTALESEFGMHAEALKDAKTTAETGEATAKAGEAQAGQKKNEAEAEKANWMEFGPLGVAVNLKTGEVKKPGGDLMSPGMLESKYVQIGTAMRMHQPVSAGDAAFFHTYEHMKELVPAFNFSLQNSGASADAGGNPSAIAQAIANGSMAWKDAVSPRTPMATKNAILSQVFKLNPNFDTSEFGLEADAAKKARSGAWADTRLAYNTAIDHSKQLLDAIDALNAGDVKKLNSLKNFFKTEFGSPDVPTYQAIANAYNHEVTSVVSKGHITDAEVQQGGSVLPDNASPQQLRGVVKAYNNLMLSKRDELDKIIKAGAGNKANSVINTQSDSAAGGGGNDPFAAFGGKARKQ